MRMEEKGCREKGPFVLDLFEMGLGLLAFGFPFTDFCFLNERWEEESCTEKNGPLSSWRGQEEKKEEKNIRGF